MKVRYPERSTGFFRLMLMMSFFYASKTFSFSRSLIDFWLVSTVMPKSSSMMNVPNWTPCDFSASRSGLRMTKTRWSVAYTPYPRSMNR